jgi:integrase/recombinase XerD
MTQLRKRMLEELQPRNYSPSTIRPYLFAVEDFARYFGKSPDKLSQEHLRQYQLHLVNDCKLTIGTIVGRLSAIRFFFVKVLRRPYPEIDLVNPKRPERLPVILSEEKVALMIESASTAYHRVILMTLYGAGLRREEVCRLKVTDVDSQRMVIHVRQGKGYKDRDVTLSPRLLEVLRDGGNPMIYLFPSYQHKRREQPISANGILHGPRSSTACRDQEEGIPTSIAAQLGNPSVGTWDRPENDSDAARYFDLEATTIYLHLLHQHLRSVNNPVETLPISGLGDKPSVRPRKGE